jgi:hypothetical protein
MFVQQKKCNQSSLVIGDRAIIGLGVLGLIKIQVLGTLPTTHIPLSMSESMLRDLGN